MTGREVLHSTVSSPNVQGLGVDGLSVSAAKKKRDKLGCHCTAVGCSKAENVLQLLTNVCQDVTGNVR
jgi:hypothetical protein